MHSKAELNECERKAENIIMEMEKVEKERQRERE